MRACVRARGGGLGSGRGGDAGGAAWVGRWPGGDADNGDDSDATTTIIPSPHRLFDCAGGTCADGAVMGRVVDALSVVVGRGQDVDTVPPWEARFEMGCGGGSGDTTNGGNHSGGGVNGDDDNLGASAAGDDSKAQQRQAESRSAWGEGLLERLRTGASSLAAFPLHHSDELAIKTELFVFHNPVIIIVQPDERMAFYPYAGVREWRSAMWRGHGGLGHSGDHRDWGAAHDHDAIAGSGSSAATTTSTTSTVTTRSSTETQPPLPVYNVTGPRLSAHAMVAIGWGAAADGGLGRAGPSHWIVRNSWGDDWGVQGFVGIAVGDVSGALVLDSRVWSWDWGFVAVVSWIVMLVVTVAMAAVERCRVVVWLQDEGCGGAVGRKRGECDAV